MAAYTSNNYNGGSQGNMGTAYKTLLNVLAAASNPRRGMIYYLFAAADGAPSVNNNVIIDVSIQTANDGTGTTLTPNKKNPADPAAASTSKANFTVETASLGAAGIINRSFNQLVAYEWRADDGDEILWPATANNGYVLRAKGQSGGYASTMFAELGFIEL